MKFDRFCLIDFSILSENFSHVCIKYVMIYEKMSSGGLEVSLSICRYSINQNPFIYLTTKIRNIQACTKLKNSKSRSESINVSDLINKNLAE